MKRSMDGQILGKMKDSIKRNNNTAFAMLLYALADPKAFKDEFEWAYALGRLFSMAMENELHTKNTELLYNEAGEAILDDKIGELLGKFNARDKASITAFLMGASKPTTQAVIDFWVEQKCLKQIGIP